MWNNAKGIMEKSRQHAQKDGSCKQRDGNIKKKSKGSLEIKYIATKMKNAFDEIISRLAQPWKESVSLKIGQETLPNLKVREEKE